MLVDIPMFQVELDFSICCNVFITNGLIILGTQIKWRADSIGGGQFSQIIRFAYHLAMARKVLCLEMGQLTHNHVLGRRLAFELLAMQLTIATG
jgi:hypothetical protein